MKKYISLSVLLLVTIVSSAQEKYGVLTNLDTINTTLDEYNTVFNTSFDKMAYTTSKTFSHGDRNEYVMFSTGEDKNWGNGVKTLALCKKISHIDVVAWPTADTLYVLNGKKYGKIYIYTFNGKKWKKRDKIKLCKTRVKKACFNSSMTEIYFSTKMSKKKGGVGGQDLYVCSKTADGKWSQPISLGDSINTWGDEIAPFLVGDSILYFASNGPKGLGGYDIFYSKLENGVWGSPVNLGEPINSPKDDAFYTYGGKEHLAFISSNRDGGKGGMDIYCVSYIFNKEITGELPPYKSFVTDQLLSNVSLQKASSIDSTKITLVKGYIMGDDSTKLQARIDISDNNLLQVIATEEADTDGSYQVMLPGGSNYGLSISHPGYLFYSENFDLPEQNEYKEINKDIILKKLAIGKNVALRNLFFAVNKSDLSEASIIELGNIIKLLNENPTIHIEIEGHTDNTGSKAHNQKLSEARAKAVVDYLVEHGIDAGRLTYKGYGMTKPVSDNTTEAGRAQNRRTEILITKL